MSPPRVSRARCGTVWDVEIQHLLVVDPARGYEFVDLPHPPEDPTCFAELVAVLGPGREVDPAGPPLRSPGHVMHRARGRVAGSTSSVPDEVAPLVSAALQQERGGPIPAARAAWCREGWSAETAAWVDEVLAQRGAHRTGRSTVIKSWGLSHVERIPTSEGVRYLKASSALLLTERAALDVLVEPGAPADALSFLGHSAGGALGGILCAVEPRLARIAIFGYGAGPPGQVGHGSGTLTRRWRHGGSGRRHGLVRSGPLRRCRPRRAAAGSAWSRRSSGADRGR